MIDNLLAGANLKSADPTPDQLEFSRHPYSSAVGTLQMAVAMKNLAYHVLVAVLHVSDKASKKGNMQ